MFEAEINKVYKSEELPEGVLRAFQQSRPEILSRTMLFWGEHCTECVYPSCYQTCELYQAREDGKCRRFVNGMEAFGIEDDLRSSILKIQFKRWAKLWSPGGMQLYKTEDAYRSERRDLNRSRRLARLPKSFRLKRFARLYDERKQRAALPVKEGGQRASCFLFECYNPQNITLKLSLKIQSEESRNTYIHLLICNPGFNSIRVPLNEIESYVDLSKPFSISIQLNTDDRDLILYFGLMDFVYLAQEENTSKTDEGSGTSNRLPKCIVWDLDDTLWHGSILEDGLNKIDARLDIIELIRKIDSLGILQSIASKNNEQDGIAALQSLGIEEFFLYPKISWEPKSQSIRTLASDLNIGLESIHFVDNSETERAEVSALLDSSNVWDPEDMQGLISLIENVSERGKLLNRRERYREESKRKKHSGSFRDHKDFVRSLEMKVGINPKPQAHFERLYELAQRTNQLNFTGNRYGKGVLQAIIEDPYSEICAIFCYDRFGDYGLIGLCIVDQKKRLVNDMAFSCRVQGRFLESAILWEIWRRFDIDEARFIVNDKNRHLLTALQEAGIDFKELNEAEYLLQKPESPPISLDLMDINWHE